MIRDQVVFGVIVVLIPLGWFISLVYVPSVTRWNAYWRIYFPALVPFLAYLAYATVATMAWPGKYKPALTPYTTGLMDRTQNVHLVGATFVSLYFVVWLVFF